MCILSLCYIILCVLLVSITKDSAENEEKKTTKNLDTKSILFSRISNYHLHILDKHVISLSNNIGGFNKYLIL